MTKLFDHSVKNQPKPWNYNLRIIASLQVVLVLLRIQHCFLPLQLHLWLWQFVICYDRELCIFHTRTSCIFALKNYFPLQLYYPLLILNTFCSVYFYTPRIHFILLAYPLSFKPLPLLLLLFNLIWSQWVHLIFYHLDMSSF